MRRTVCWTGIEAERAIARLEGEERSLSPSLFCPGRREMNFPTSIVPEYFTEREVAIPEERKEM
jgi:hypothetical protein